MRSLNAGVTSLVISILVTFLAIAIVALPAAAFGGTAESESILLFVLTNFLGIALTGLMFALPLGNLFGIGLSVISLLEKREQKIFALLGFTINSVSYLFALIFHLFATLLGAFFVCPIDIVGAIVLIPIFFMIYRRRNKFEDLQTETTVNQSV